MLPFAVNKMLKFRHLLYSIFIMLVHNEVFSLIYHFNDTTQQGTTIKKSHSTGQIVHNDSEALRWEPGSET